MAPSLSKSWPDWLGIVASSLCLLHCGVLPLLLTLQVLHLQVLEFPGIDAFLAVTAALGVWLGSRHHTLSVRIGMWALLGLLVLGLVVEHTAVGHWVIWLTALGLASFHVRNIVRHKACGYTR